MQVILLERIQKLGGIGDLANVKAGYARNFLIPQGKVKPATKNNLAEFEVIKADLLAKEAAALADAKAKEAAMNDVTCSIQANASDEGKLFGSVSTTDILDNLTAQGFEVEKRDIHLPESIRHVGEYEVSVSLYTDMAVNVKVIVEAATESE
jgi:large subunit ribosomal protein L9